MSSEQKHVGISSAKHKKYISYFHPTETLQLDQKIRLFDFLAKNMMPYAAKQLEITFPISLTLFKAILRL